MGAYSRWALIRGWELIRINTVPGQRIAKIDELMLTAWSLVPFTKYIPGTGCYMTLSCTPAWAKLPTAELKKAL